MSTVTQWYGSKGSGGQGLIAEEDTGRTVAVAYDEKDTALLSAAPDLLHALTALHHLIDINSGRPCIEALLVKMQDAKQAIQKATAQ